MKYLSKLKQKDLKGKVCLLRIDLNIKDEELSGENLRIQAVLPTIKFLLENDAKVVLLSHRGRPQNRGKNGEKQKFSLKMFTKIFEKLLKEKVEFINPPSPLLKRGFGGLLTGSSKIFIFENLRFFEGEDKNDKKLAKQLAMLGDIYVNEAFAFSHRKTASMFSIPQYLPSYAGLLFEKEIENLDKVREKTWNNAEEDPLYSPFQRGKRRGLVLIMGGAKISDKIGLIKKFINRADYVLVGGGIANNFFKSQGLPIGESVYDPNADKSGFVSRLVRNEKIVLPVDAVIEKNKILDIGPNTVKLYSDIIKKAKIIIWNGPMGMIENKKFRKGSEEIVKAIIESKAFAVVGGGETASLFSLKAKNLKLKANLFVSTGGGAMLEYLSGKKLPGIISLNKNKKKI